MQTTEWKMNRKTMPKSYYLLEIVYSSFCEIEFKISKQRFTVLDFKNKEEKCLSRVKFNIF